MSSTTQHIDRLEAKIAELKAALEELRADSTVHKGDLLSKYIANLLASIAKDEATTQVLTEWSTQLQAKDEQLQKREAELQQKTLTVSMTEESQRLQSTSNELQSTSKGLELQLQGLERVASDLATNTTSTEELRRQHKEEVDVLSSTISQLQTKINDWESRHKDRLAEFNAKRQEALANFEEREIYLAAKKEHEMLLKIEALQELRAADQAESRKHETLRAMKELERKKQKIADDIRDHNASLDRWATSFDKAKMISKQQIDRLRGWCTDLHGDIRAMDSQIKALEIREGKLPDSAHGALMSGMIDTEPVADEVTQSTSSKRVHKPSSTSTDQSPRKEPAKRMKQAGLSAIDSPPTADVPQRSIPRPSLPARAPLPPSTPTPTGNETRRTSRIPFAVPTRRPPIPNLASVQTPASQASSSWTGQPIPRASGQGQTTISHAGTEAKMYETFSQSDVEGTVSPTALEREEFAAGLSGTQSPDTQEAGESHALTVPREVELVWEQLLLGDNIGRREQTDLLQWMTQAENRRKKLQSRPAYLLQNSADKADKGEEVCFTSRLRGRGSGLFLKGRNDPCNECTKTKQQSPCFRVKWASDQARTEVNAEKRWTLERR
ncbi:MAG: hypothetical protein LQ341_001667 [Variospora aurantia]|nr:MAG: hypothetical protein LQ341_001667 [Variospora aurantia]